MSSAYLMKTAEADFGRIEHGCLRACRVLLRQSRLRWHLSSHIQSCWLFQDTLFSPSRTNTRYEHGILHKTCNTVSGFRCIRGRYLLGMLRPQHVSFTAYFERNYNAKIQVRPIPDAPRRSRAQPTPDDQRVKASIDNQGIEGYTDVNVETSLQVYALLAFSSLSWLQLLVSSHRSEGDISLYHTSIYDDRHPHSLSYDINLRCLETIGIRPWRIFRKSPLCEICLARHVASTLRQ
ncbi:hypothetical protein EV421DRAFT_999987 [Armillaria borealis]|uniref:Uncharacterized protein n=1 Tax=Armillaria borealis TaxID=47425 RepID=A0AA39J9E6_9AGAR|nr:hypothetical protein EV421DRAFT_999987 [Armillaria borealis]